MRLTSALITLFVLLTVSPSAGCADPVGSKLQDRTQTEMTLYSDGFGLIREVRKTTVPQGDQTLHLEDIPEQLVAESLHVRSLNQPGKLTVLEQSFHNDVLDTGRLLDYFVGKKIKIEQWNQFQDRKEIVEATLLSNAGEPIYEVNGEVRIGLSGVRILPEIPAGMALKPSLNIAVQNQAAEAHDLELTYISYGLSWSAHYVLSLEGDTENASLSCWVSLVNQLQTSFDKAKLRLVAGSVNQTPPQAPSPRFMMKAVAYETAADSGAGFSESNAFEYHVYDYAKPVSLEKLEKKQVEFIPSRAVKIKKEYEFSSQDNNYYYQRYSGPEDEKSVDVYITLKNDNASGLGLPLPAGTVRLYQSSADSNTLFLGEDRMAHTGENEKIRLKTGQAFDLKAERKQTDYKQITSQMHETEWEITLRNSKEQPVEISVIETLPYNSQWKMIAESQPHEKESAFQIRYRVQVPAMTELKFRYRIQAGY